MTDARSHTKRPDRIVGEIHRMHGVGNGDVGKELTVGTARNVKLDNEVRNGGRQQCIVA